MTNTIGPDVGREFAKNIETRSPVHFGHGLVGHPLLTLDSIADLAEELPARSISAERAEKPLAAGDARLQAMPTTDIGGQIRSIAATSSWFTLLNVEQAARYRALVDEIIDGLAASSGLPGATLRRRMGFLFASSPRAVTAAHFDIEHSFCMQLQGSRKLGFGKFADTAQRTHEVNRYWHGSFGRFDELPEQIAEYDLTPGTGCYIPPYTPHWITNGDSKSLSMTVTFFNRDNEDESLVQAFNTKIARLGIKSPVYGEAPRRDRVKAGAMRAYASVKRRIRPEQSASH